LHNVLAMFWHHRTPSANKQYIMFWIASWTNQRVLQSTVGMTVMIQGPWTGRWTDCTDELIAFCRMLLSCECYYWFDCTLAAFHRILIGEKGGWRMLYNHNGVGLQYCYMTLYEGGGVKKSTILHYIIYGQPQSDEYSCQRNTTTHQQSGECSPWRNWQHPRPRLQVSVSEPHNSLFPTATLHTRTIDKS